MNIELNKLIGFQNKIIQSIIIFLFLTILVLFVDVSYAENKTEPVIEAESAILIDSGSNLILYQKDSNSKRPMASTTKMMTAIIILEESKLSEMVKMSASAEWKGETELELRNGDQLTVLDMLNLLLVKSADDTAIALAEHNSGSVNKFVEKMNKKANLIGANNTNFMNSHGHPKEGHYTTAQDLALITQYALKKPEFAKIVSTRIFKINFKGKEFNIENTNELLHKFSYITGVKTGHTKSAGYCLVTSASRDNIDLISVVLKSPTGSSVVQDSEKLIEYGFSRFKKVRVIEKGKVYKRLKLPGYLGKTGKLIADADCYIKAYGDNDKAIRTEMSKIKNISLPLDKGKPLAEIRIYYNNKLNGKIRLITAEDYKELGLEERVYNRISHIIDKIKKFF